MTQVKVAAGTCMGLLEVAAGRVSHVLDDTLQRLEELAKDLKYGQNITQASASGLFSLSAAVLCCADCSSRRTQTQCRAWYRCLFRRRCFM